MEIQQTEIDGVFIINPKVHQDSRGFFLETYNQEKYHKAGIPYLFVQDNHSGSKRYTLRGLHYQIRQPQGKLIAVVKGEIYDVAVDIRKNSPTFGQAVQVELSELNKKQLWIPPGFAHGFMVTSDWAEVTYKVTDFYAPEWERTILWNDPQLGIQWPLVTNTEVHVSTKDASGLLLREAEIYEDLG